MPVAVAVAGLVIAAAGTTMSIISGNQARAAARHQADLQKQANDEIQARNDAQRAQEQRQLIREARVKQARIEQMSANTGTTGSSGEIGATSAISTNLSSSLGMNNTTSAVTDSINNINAQIGDSQTDQMNAQKTGILGQGLTSIGSSLFSAGGGFKTMGSIFDKK
ncbi:hypothetical protein [Burkholderia territorii]|uniref:hypothetical protein n=1 Tax=Burkholderia territorii TaxID=1503055 RepID=UPI0012D9C980|nr:hypothetical protein [Burkholderia territorii]